MVTARRTEPRIVFSAFCDTSGMTCRNTAEEEENGGAGRSAAERSAAGDAWGAEGGAFSFTGFAVESEAFDATFAANAALRDSSFEEFAGFASDKPAAFRQAFLPSAQRD